MVNRYIKVLYFLLALIATPVYSDIPAPLVNLRMAVEGLWIEPSQYKKAGEPRFIRFVVIPYENSDYGSLKINFELPKNNAHYTPTYLLKRGEKTCSAESFIHREHDFYTLDLPNLQKDERIEFSIGWQGASPSNYKISAWLITDNQSKSAQWIGWLFR